MLTKQEKHDAMSRLLQRYAERDRLKRQAERDELLAACKAAIQELEAWQAEEVARWFPRSRKTDGVIAQLQAAIAKAKEKPNA